MDFGTYIILLVGCWSAVGVFFFWMYWALDFGIKSANKQVVSSLWVGIILGPIAIPVGAFIHRDAIINILSKSR